MRTADAGDQEPGRHAHERVQPLRDHEHARALLALGGARPSPGPPRSPRCCAAPAGSRRATPPARTRPARRPRGRGPAASRSRAAPAGRTPGRPAGASAPDASSRASPGPRMRATIRTESAGPRLGFTLPDRSDDPPPAATSSGSERNRSCRGHPQAPDPRRPRRDDGLPRRGGCARRHGREPRPRLRLRRVRPFAHQRARRRRDDRRVPRREARAARRHARRLGGEPARART